MKLLIVDDDGQRVAWIERMSPEAYKAFEDSALKLLSDQTDDPHLAAMILLTSFMRNVGGRGTDSIFLTGINEGLMKVCDDLTTSVGMGKTSQFLARLMQSAGHDALHIINNILPDGRFGHTLMFTGVPAETMEGWMQLSEVADIPVGELLGRIMTGGVHFGLEQKEHFKKKMQEEREIAKQRKAAQSLGKKEEEKTRRNSQKR